MAASRTRRSARAPTSPEVVAYLGDGERALALAEEALAIALEQVPPAASLAHVARADALIALERHAEAHAPLDEVDLMMLPEPDRTFLMVAALTTRTRLALADGDVDGAEATARGVLEDLRANGVTVLEAQALVALATAHLAADRFEDAGSELVGGHRTRRTPRGTPRAVGGAGSFGDRAGPEGS